MNKLKNIIILFAIVLIFSFVLSPSYAIEYDLSNDVFATPLEAKTKANEFLNNSRMIDEVYKNKPYTTDNFIEIYDIDDNLIAYSIETIFGDKIGYTLVGATKNLFYVWEVAEENLLKTTDFKQINDISTRGVKDPKYIFGGPFTYLVKYSIDPDEDIIINIETNEQIINLKAYRPTVDLNKISNNNDSLNKSSYVYNRLKYTLPIVDQMDFSTKPMQNTGCGPATGAILTWYLGENNSNYYPVIEYWVVTGQGELELGEYFYQEMGSTFGTLPAMFRAGLNNHFKHNLPSRLRPEIVTTTRRNGYSAIWNSINDGVGGLNTPVALYMGVEMPGGSESGYPEPGYGLSPLHWIAIHATEEINDFKGFSFQTWGRNNRIANFNSVWYWRNSLSTEYIDVRIR